MGQLRTLMDEHPQARWHAVVDGAVLEGLLDPLYALGKRQFACLLAGRIEADVAHVAPYLVALGPDNPLAGWLEARLSLPWGYVIESPLPFPALHLHLRRFSSTRGPRGEDLVFRFWDPRVLRSMPAILTAAQAAAFMEGISRIHLLDTDRTSSVEWDADAGKLLVLAPDERQPVDRGAAHHAGV
jgi:hypothetical protein